MEERLRTEPASLGQWLRQYGRERELRLQAARVVGRLADELPNVYVAAASRPLSESEVDALVAGLLGQARVLLARHPAESPSEWEEIDVVEKLAC
ncbi:MAG: hypothetical protein ACYC3S_00705 [Chloroflexota bacterium]